MKQLWHFLGLVFRPHPYAWPADNWQDWLLRWMRPFAAWEMAGDFVSADEFRNDAPVSSGANGLTPEYPDCV